MTAIRGWELKRPSSTEEYKTSGSDLSFPSFIWRDVRKKKYGM
jgi:hypothetical protein